MIYLSTKRLEEFKRAVPVSVQYFGPYALRNSEKTHVEFIN